MSKKGIRPAALGNVNRLGEVIGNVIHKRLMEHEEHIAVRMVAQARSHEEEVARLRADLTRSLQAQEALMKLLIEREARK